MDLRTQLHREAERSNGGYVPYLKNVLVRLDCGDLHDPRGETRETVEELIGAYPHRRTISTNTTCVRDGRYESTESWTR